MGNAWSSLKEKRKEKKELKRYFRRFYFSILDSLLFCVFPELTLSPNNSTLTKKAPKRFFGQISSSIETKLVLIHILFIPRKEKTYRILTASAERERISKRKKQLEQEIELIERKIYLEKMMHIARKRHSRPQVRRVIARYESF